MQPFVLRRLAQGQWHLFGPPVTWGCVDTHSCCEFQALHHMSIHQPGLDNCGIGHTGPCRTCTNGSPCNMAHFWGSSWPSVTANRACPGSLIYLWWSCPCPPGFLWWCPCPWVPLFVVSSTEAAKVLLPVGWLSWSYPFPLFGWS